MNVRGERVIVFGDSLSHHGADAAPEIWDVDQASGRISSQPGDLLASMLAEQGAQAVRVNARVGRSAHNFFGRENTQALLGSDAAFKPTKVVVILGTNDIGLNLSIDAQDMARIRDLYKTMGAEVWAIGPVAYVSSQLNAQAEPVVAMMREVFGPRFIDGRPISAVVGRARDGVHFGSESARQTALAMTNALLSTKGPVNWVPIVLGAGAAVLGALVWSYWRSRKYPTPIAGLSATHVDGLDGYRVTYVDVNVRRLDPQVLSTLKGAEKLRRAYSRRGHWAYVEDEQGNHVPVKGAMTPSKYPLERLGKLNGDDDDDDDLDKYLRLSEQRRKAHADKLIAAFKQSPAVITTDRAGRQELVIRSGEMQNTKEGRFRVTFLMPDGPRGHATKDTDEALAQEVDFETVRPATDADVIAWTSTPKYIEGSKRVAFTQAANMLHYRAGQKKQHERAREIEHQAHALVATNIDEAIAVLEAGVKEFSGLRLHGGVEPIKKRYQELLEDSDPNAMQIAEDLLLENQIKLSDISQTVSSRHGAFKLTPGKATDWEHQTTVHWKIEPGSGRCTAEFNVNIDGERVGGPAMLLAYDPSRPHAGSRVERVGEGTSRRFKAHYSGGEDYCRRAAAGDAWAIAKKIKTLKVAKLSPELLQDYVEKSIRSALDEDNSQPEDLYGLDARRRPESETRVTEDGPGMGPPSQGKLQIGRKGDSYKDLPWSKVIAEAKKEAKADEKRSEPGSNNLRLSMHVKHAPSGRSQQAFVTWDPLDAKGAIKFAEKLVDDGGAMYASVVGMAERPHASWDRNPPQGHWTLAEFEAETTDR